MRTKISPLRTPGFVSDTRPYELPPEAFTEVRNARFNIKGAEAVGGHRQVFSAADFNPLWLRVFPPIQNPLWVYAGLEKVVAFDGSHNDISRLSSPYNAIASERWQGEVFQGLGVFNNTVDVPQLWPQFDASEKLIDLPNWPANVRCKFLRAHKNWLFAGNLDINNVNYPFRILWGDPAEPGAYPASWAENDPQFDSGWKDIADTKDHIVDGLTLGDFFIVYKQTSTWLFQYVGRPNIWAHWELCLTKGAMHRDCIQPIFGGHFVAGTDDIWIHQGRKGSEKSIVEGQVRDWIFRQIDASTFMNCYTVDYDRRNEIWFCFPEAGETYPTIALIWNKLTGGIGFKDLDRCPFIYAGPVDLSTGGSSRTWDGGSGPPPVDTNRLLQEDGFFRLLEDGSYRLFED